jgi:NTE family protein
MTLPGADDQREHQLTEFLRDVPLFGSMSADQLDRVRRELQPFSLPGGETLIREGDAGDALYIIAGGRLEATAGSPPVRIGEVTPGEIVGETALLTGDPRSATVTAMTNTHGYRLDRERVLRIIEEHPAEMRRVAELITRRSTGPRREQFRPSQEEIVAFLSDVPLFASLPPTTLAELAPHLQWFTITRNEILIRQGEPGDRVYLLVSGRLRYEVRDVAGGLHRSGTIERGEVVGEMALLTEETRTATVIATRDCGILTLSPRTLGRLMTSYPRVVLAVTRLLAQRLVVGARGERQRPRSATIALLPIHPGVPLGAISRRLERAVGAYGEARLLTKGMAIRAIGDAARERTPEARTRFARWVHDQEERAPTVLLTGIHGDDEWNARCVDHADRVFLFVDPSRSPDLTPLELRTLGGGATHGTTTELVFVYPDSTTLAPGVISPFRARRVHLRAHHLREENGEDVARLARFVTNRTVGIALGGGGARGLAHIGAIAAIREAGIPIDLVAGTSIGSLVGSVVAMGFSTEAMVDVARRYLIEDAPFFDPAIPVVSLLRGRKITAGLHRFFGERRIEEQPLPYVAVATDLGSRDVVPIVDGPFWKAVRASVSIPGLMPPVLDGERMLVDGGLLNNAPADILRELGADRTILLDVSGGDARDLSRYRDVPAGAAPGSAPSFVSYLARRLSGKNRWPSIGETLLTSFVVGSERHARESAAGADCALHLPTGPYPMLRFGNLDELVRLGYEATSSHTAEWRATLG